MFNQDANLNLRINQQKHTELMRYAEIQRQVRMVNTKLAQRLTLHQSILMNVGKRMVAFGTRLQNQYAESITTTQEHNQCISGVA
jgi:hypothetical protein